MSKLSKKLLGFVLVVLLSSCVNSFLENAPFIISKPICVLEGSYFEYTYAGIQFDFLNKSNKSISSITVSFLLYDAKTQTNPFMGSNVFEITKLTFISPDENKEIILSLDKFIYIAPSEPYLIDHFYIKKIEYTDGSTWEDKHGVFSI